jgi:hypothetical protein
LLIRPTQPGDAAKEAKALNYPEAVEVKAGGAWEESG